VELVERQQWRPATEQGGAGRRANARGGKERFISARDGSIVTSTRAEEGVTTGRAGKPGARAYPGATRGGVDSRGPRRACLPREGSLPREAWPRAAQPAWERGPVSPDAKAGAARTAHATSRRGWRSAETIPTRQL
jgi:hypothetical protein